MSIVLYSVEEVNRLGMIRAKLHTRDFFLAIADWMLRVHKPLGFPPGAKVGEQSLDFNVLGQRMPLDDLWLEMGGKFTLRGEIVRSITVKTNLVTLDIDEGFTLKTGEIYHSSEYWLALQKMRERVYRFCLGQAYAAYVLAQFASRDPLHPFWKPILGRMGKSFGM